MTTPTKLASFGLALALVFGAAFGIGRAVGPIDLQDERGHQQGDGDLPATPEATLGHDVHD